MTDLFAELKIHSADRGPVLVGMNNPLSVDPRHALYPAPVNCTGWRAWRMYHEARVAGAAPSDAPSEIDTKKEYLALFERRNVAPTLHWPSSTAERTRLGRALMDDVSGRALVVFGVATLKALTLPRPASWFEWAEHVWLPDAVTRYVLLPHPSGPLSRVQRPRIPAQGRDRHDGGLRPMSAWTKFLLSVYLFFGLLQFGHEYSWRIADFCTREYVTDAVRCDRALRAQGASTLVAAAVWPLTYAREAGARVAARLSLHADAPEASQ